MLLHGVQMPIVPREKLDTLVDRRYLKIRARIWGQIEEFLLGNEDLARLVDSFVNALLDDATKKAIEIAVKSGSRIVTITAPIAKMAQHLHSRFHPEARRAVTVDAARMILEFALTERGYNVENGTLSYQHEVPEPQQDVEHAELVKPLELGGPTDSTEEEAIEEIDTAPKPRRENWRRAQELEEPPEEASPRPTVAPTGTEPELVEGKSYTNKRGLERQVQAVSEDGKVRYLVVKGSPKIPEGTEGECTIWAFMKWTKN